MISVTHKKSRHVHSPSESYTPLTNIGGLLKVYYLQGFSKSSYW